MAPQKKNENGPVTAHFTSRVTTSVSVDNFRKRMERLSIMGEEELQNSSEIVSFQSKVIPLSLPEATNVGDVVYLVTVGIELQRQGNINVWAKNEGDEVILEVTASAFELHSQLSIVSPRKFSQRLKSGTSHGFNDFLPVLLNHYSIDNLTIYFSVEVCSVTSFEDAEKILTNQADALSASDLRMDLLKLEGITTDITLICDNEKFPAHKTILGARSDVFSAMFQHNGTHEAETNEVEIDDTDARTVKRFLHYVYGGSVTGLNFEDADPLMIMAEKYNLQGLQAASRSILLGKLTPANSIRAAIVGYHCNDDILKDAAMKKIVSSGKSIKEIKDYEELKKYPELSIEMLEHYSSTLSLK